MVKPQKGKCRCGHLAPLLHLHAKARMFLSIDTERIVSLKLLSQLEKPGIGMVDIRSPRFSTRGAESGNPLNIMRVMARVTKGQVQEEE